jgi:hypothetical protein
MDQITRRQYLGSCRYDCIIYAFEPSSFRFLCIELGWCLISDQVRHFASILCPAIMPKPAYLAVISRHNHVSLTHANYEFSCGEAQWDSTDFSACIASILFLTFVLSVLLARPITWTLKVAPVPIVCDRFPGRPSRSLLHTRAGMLDGKGTAIRRD